MHLERKPSCLFLNRGQCRQTPCSSSQVLLKEVDDSVPWPVQRWFFPLSPSPTRQNCQQQLPCSPPGQRGLVFRMLPAEEAVSRRTRLRFCRLWFVCLGPRFRKGTGVKHGNGHSPCLAARCRSEHKMSIFKSKNQLSRILALHFSVKQSFS